MTMYGFDIQRINNGKPYWHTLRLDSDSATAFMYAVHYLQYHILADIIGVTYDTATETAEFMAVCGQQVSTYAINAYHSH